MPMGGAWRGLEGQASVVLQPIQAHGSVWEGPDVHTGECLHGSPEACGHSEAHRRLLGDQAGPGDGCVSEVTLQRCSGRE